jgi:hypothetical protein
MSDQDKLPTPPAPEQHEAQEAFIPPGVLLGLSAFGFLVALVVAFTQPTFGVIGYGGLAFGVLALLAWVLLAPSQARGVLTGRTVRFGGTSLLVTVLLVVALGAIYVVARNQGIRLDLTQSNAYSLTEESRQAISGYGADPSLPQVRLLAFYTAAQAGSRDRDTALFDDYVTTSNGKLSYEFIDPDRNPQQANLYSVTRPGQIVVAAVTDASTTPVTLDTEDAVTVNNAAQEGLTNAILRAAAQGQFVAYFITTRDGAAADMTNLQNSLTNRFNWTVQVASLAELTSPGAEHPLNDPNLDGEVMILPGGSAALSAEELQIVQDYLAGGGDLIIYAGTNLNQERTSLATDPALNDYLLSTFGFRFDTQVVVDQTQAFQSPLLPVSTNLDTSAYITTAGIQRGQGALIFETPNSITLADAPPADVTTTVLSRSSESSYAISDLERILSNDLAQQDADAQGPFVMGVQAVSSATGARVVAFTSTSITTDNYAPLNVDNFPVAFNSVVWATDFNNFVSGITIPQQQRPQDQPLYADEQDLRNINFLTIVLLPAGILLIGLYVWWNGRQRGQARR